METLYGTYEQLSLFPEIGIEGQWLDYPFAWIDLDARYVRFFAQVLHANSRTLLESSQNPDYEFVKVKNDFR